MHPTLKLKTWKSCGETIKLCLFPFGVSLHIKSSCVAVYIQSNVKALQLAPLLYSCEYELISFEDFSCIAFCYARFRFKNSVQKENGLLIFLSNPKIVWPFSLVDAFTFEWIKTRENAKGTQHNLSPVKCTWVECFFYQFIVMRSILWKSHK